MKKILYLFFILCTTINVCAQQLFTKKTTFTEADTLRGSITPERAWWDVVHYDLDVTVFPEEKSIKGTNTITYKVLDKAEVMQIDLQEPMQIDKVEHNGKETSVTRKGAVHYLKLKKQPKGTEQQVVIYFSGKPRVAKNAPWDGGFSWKNDANGNPFIATSNQGIGASIWWPNKDHGYDEPDNGINLAITAPSNLVAVGNGRLINTESNGTTKKWHWKVTNPINNYGVNINIGDYVSFTEKFEGLKGSLDCEYWVLQYNLEKAKDQFEQAGMMLRAFEYWFGPYPFYEDSFKLVEVPYLGMEHQSSVTYGNKYQNGYLGSDLSGTGWGLRFDFIIIHEGGHEWFANNITTKDVADMWVHEGFTAYSESLYLNYHYSDVAASEYVIGTRRSIRNDRPLIGIYGVHNEGSSDMYYKGANILHTLRQLVEDDKKWRAILTGLNKQFYHQTVTSKQVEDYISKQSGIDLTEFWDQYLRTIKIPKIEFKYNNKDLSYRYTNIIEGFDMPVIAIINGKEKWIYPTKEWKTEKIEHPIESVKIKEDFYVDSKLVE